MHALYLWSLQCFRIYFFRFMKSRFSCNHKNTYTFCIGKKWIWKTPQTFASRVKLISFFEFFQIKNLSQERPREPIIYRNIFLFLAYSTLKYYLFKSILHICVYNPSTFLYAMYIIYCILIRNESQTVEWCDIRIRDTWSTYYPTYIVLYLVSDFLNAQHFKIVTKIDLGGGITSLK